MLQWYQQIILNQCIDLYGIDHIKSTVEWLIPLNEGANVFEEIEKHGSSLFNRIILETKSPKLKHSLLNHGIEERYQWFWRLDEGEVIVSPKWFNSIDECFKNAKLNEPSVDIVGDVKPAEMHIESFCQCMYDKKIKAIPFVHAF